MDPATNPVAQCMEAGDVVQLNPEAITAKCFGGCFLVVTTVHNWGVIGYILDVGRSMQDLSRPCYYRAEWAEFEYIGKAAFLLRSSEGVEQA